VVQAAAGRGRYWERPEESAQTFRSDGWYRTGDIGREAAGYYYVTDRLKDMIISGGENIYPAEIERALLECPDIADVAVFAVPDERWGETPRAEVVLAPGSPRAASGVRRLAAAFLTARRRKAREGNQRRPGRRHQTRLKLRWTTWRFLPASPSMTSIPASAPRTT
jgi:acyl-CoA synthetase (AMP-forming)/AMP-acid ligase II